MLRNSTPSNSTSHWPDAVWYGITALFFVILVSVVGYSFVQQQKKFLLDEKQKELATIADMKSSQLVQWRKERFAEAASIRANAMMTHRIASYLAGNDVEEVRDEISRWMANLVDLGEYSKAVLFAPDGRIIAATTEPDHQLSQHYRSMISEAVENHELILSDFHADEPEKNYDIDLIVPIMQINGTRAHCTAVLLLDIAPAKRLNPLIRAWPTSDVTAETLLVRREGDSVLFLNDLRHRDNIGTPFRQPLTETQMPAVRAALGEEGNYSGIDYRNVAVISAIRTVPGTRWGIVAKIDRSEVLEPLSRYIYYVALSGVFVVSSMIMGMFLWGQRRKAESLRNLFEVQKKAEKELLALHAGLESQILERTSDLTEINTLLRSEMDERKLLEQLLLAAKRLEAIGQIAGGVAHEVRNPLNAILTVTEALFREKEIEGNPEFQPYIRHIREQVNRLAQLMNDLLDLGRTIPEANLQPLPLYQLCRDALDLWKSTGMAKNREGILESGNGDSSVQILGDGLKLQQIIFNLLENAGNHTPPGSCIVIKLLYSAPDLPDGMAAVRIIDQGTGISGENLPHVFEPFYTERKGGTGLGLALVKHFIVNMGGSVQIWNNSPPPGCTVEVRIPLYRVDIST